MSAVEYRVQLDHFQGPLDLLLYLVRRHEIDARELPLAEITRQFIEFADVLECLELELVGDFIVMAASLVEIKSRQSLPQPEETDEEIEIDDSQNRLIERLLEYKKFKTASLVLEERAAEWQERFPRLSDDRPRDGKDPAADRIKDVELWDLVSALGRVLKRKEIDKQTRIQYDDTPISVYIEQVGKRVRREGRASFSSFFERINDRHRIVGLFLAMLELLRHHGFRAEQTADFGEIWLLPPVAEDRDRKEPETSS